MSSVTPRKARGKFHDRAELEAALDRVIRVRIYARVSTEDQRDRETVKAQLDKLHAIAAAYQWEVVGVYVDDGISGTVPLRDRPDGRRLLDDVADDPYPSMVILYRLDRLGRTVQVLMDAHDQLEHYAVPIKSVTEPFDTSEPIGKFLFQLLGSIAELEKATIKERMTLGRDQLVKEKKRWFGVIPFGYDVNADGELVLSTRRVEALGCTEAELMRELFERVAAGSSCMEECRRLNALGVPVPGRRYTTGTRVAPRKAGWVAQNLASAMHNELYYGRREFDSQYGLLVGTVPALIPEELWQQVQAQLTNNRKLSLKNARRDYVLRGRIFCAECARAYTGATWSKPGTDREIRYYRCSSAPTGAAGVPGARCAGRRVQADVVEGAVWADCRYWLEHPEAAIGEAQASLRKRLGAAPDRSDERRRLRARQQEQMAERERVQTMFKRNLMTLDELEREMGQQAAAADATARELRALEDQLALADAAEAQLTEVATLLRTLHDELPAIERDPDTTRRQQIIQKLVARVEVRTPADGAPEAEVTYTFTPPRVVVEGKRPSTCNYYTATVARVHAVGRLQTALPFGNH